MLFLKDVKVGDKLRCENDRWTVLEVLADRLIVRDDDDGVQLQLWAEKDGTLFETKKV